MCTTQFQPADKHPAAAAMTTLSARRRSGPFKYARLSGGAGALDDDADMLAQANQNGMTTAQDVTDPDNVWLNLRTANSADNTSGALGPPATFSDSRTQPLVHDASAYKVSVARFMVRGHQGVPYFTPDIASTATDPNQTPYVIGVTATTPIVGTDITQAVGATGWPAVTPYTLQFWNGTSGTGAPNTALLAITTLAAASPAYAVGDVVTLTNVPDNMLPTSARFKITAMSPTSVTTGTDFIFTVAASPDDTVLTPSAVSPSGVLSGSPTVFTFTVTNTVGFYVGQIVAVAGTTGVTGMNTNATVTNFTTTTVTLTYAGGGFTGTLGLSSPTLTQNPDPSTIFFPEQSGDPAFPGTPVTVSGITTATGLNDTGVCFFVSQTQIGVRYDNTPSPGGTPGFAGSPYVTVTPYTNINGFSFVNNLPLTVITASGANIVLGAPADVVMWPFPAIDFLRPPQYVFPCAPSFAPTVAGNGVAQSNGSDMFIYTYGGTPPVAVRILTADVSTLNSGPWPSAAAYAYALDSVCQGTATRDTLHRFSSWHVTYVSGALSPTTNPLMTMTLTRSSTVSWPAGYQGALCMPDNSMATWGLANGLGWQDAAAIGLPGYVYVPINTGLSAVTGVNLGGGTLANGGDFAYQTVAAAAANWQPNFVAGEGDGFPLIHLRGAPGSGETAVFTRTLEWVPEFPDPAPPGPAANGGVIALRPGSRYYHGMGPGSVVGMANRALASIWTSVNAHAGSTTATGTGGTFPGLTVGGLPMSNGALPPYFDVSPAGVVSFHISATDWTFNGWGETATPWQPDSPAVGTSVVPTSITDANPTFTFAVPSTSGFVVNSPVTIAGVTGTTGTPSVNAQALVTAVLTGPARLQVAYLATPAGESGLGVGAGTTITTPYVEPQGYGTPAFKIQMNPALFLRLFSGMGATFVASPAPSSLGGLTGGYATADWPVGQGVYELRMPDPATALSRLVPGGYGASPLTPLGTAVWLDVPQFTSCTDTWPAASTLVFTSTLPLIFEEEGTPFNTAAPEYQSAGRNIVPIMTDVEPALTGGAGDWGPASALVYAPTVVKWNLMSGGEIKDTTIQVLWTHRLTGQRFPVYFGPGGSAEIKILLARR